MNIQEHVPLDQFSTFGTKGSARYFSHITESEQIHEVIVFAHKKKLPYFILSGGSNVVFHDSGFDGIVLWLDVHGIDFEITTGLVTVGAGEQWDAVVAQTVAAGWWGLETLSLIPGRTGAAAVQNIGAYGTEVSELIVAVRAYDCIKQEVVELSNIQCGFGYRSSIFNTTHKGRYIILETVFQLSKNGSPNIAYPDVQAYFAEYNITRPTLQQIREAIVAIRTKKFPTDQRMGSAGSFFKNVYCSSEEYAQILQRVTESKGNEIGRSMDEVVQKFSTSEQKKIPAGLLIDKVCQLKGTRIGHAMVSETQALAILNMNKQATSDEVVQLVEKIQREVENVTGIRLILEPEFIGFSTEQMARIS